MKIPRTFTLVILLALGAAAVWFGWQAQQARQLPEGLFAANGRLEATEVDVATKVAGRLGEMRVQEGDTVTLGQLLARLDASELEAQVRAAQAQVEQAQRAVDETRAGVRKSQSDVSLADKTLKRSEELVGRGFLSRSKLDNDQTTKAGAEAGAAQARSRVAEAGAAVASAQARLESLQATLADLSLKAPINGRVLYRLAQAGEVLPAGGKVLTLVDLSDMYMTVYLPTDLAGQLAIGSEARIVLDAYPDQPVPATVSFVAPKAQFTPREVETRSEREKLMFRVKVRPDASWLAAHRDLAKGGMPGVAYLRKDPALVWPAFLSLAQP